MSPITAPSSSAKRIIPFSELVLNIKNVTAGDVRRVANELFQDERLNLAVVGLARDRDHLEKIFHLN